MNAFEMKEYIKQDTYNRVSILLKGIGCHSIKEYPKEIRSALPNKNNPTSVVIKKEKLFGKIYKSENEIVKGDIFSIIMNISNYDFLKTMKYCHTSFGLSYNYYGKDKVEKPKSHPLDIFRKIKRKQFNYDIETLPEYILEKFEQIPHIDFLKDNISPQTMKVFDVRYSPFHSRIIIPHRKWDTGELVGIFGRTTIDNFEELNIPKYYGIVPYFKGCNLYGLNINYAEIQNAGYVVVTEAEKSVQQAYTFCEKTLTAVGCHEITPEQAKILIGLDVEVIIGFDKGIDREHINKVCQMFYKKRKVSYIDDEMGFLQKDDSPTDRGKMIFELLLENRKIYDPKDFPEEMKKYNE